MVKMRIADFVRTKLDTVQRPANFMPDAAAADISAHAFEAHRLIAAGPKLDCPVDSRSDGPLFPEHPRIGLFIPAHHDGTDRGRFS